MSSVWGRPERRGARTALRLLYVLPAAWMLGHLFPPINHDAALLLRLAERWIEGDRLYVDMIDVNPPLIVWLLAVPAWLGSVVPAVETPTWFAACVIGAVVVSTALTRAALRRAVPRERGLTRTALPLAAATLLAVLPDYDFGQREHLMLCGALPYVALAAARWADRRVPAGLVLAIGAWSGVVFAVKPMFLAVPAAVELALLLRRGLPRTLRDPVPWLIGAAAAAHVGAILLFAPEYLSVAVPMAVELYEPLRQGRLEVLLGPYLLPAGLAWAVMALVAWRTTDDPLSRVIAIAVPAAIAAAAVQGMGWRYHCLPAVALAVWLGCALATERAERGARGALMGPAAAAGVAAALMAAVWVPTAVAFRPFERQLEFDDSLPGRVLGIVEEHAGERPVLFMSADPWPTYPVLNYADNTMAMRLPSLWPLPGLYSDCPPGDPVYRPAARMSRAERFVFEGVAADFVRQKPSLVIVQNDFHLWGCQGQRFDFLAYFRRNPAFEAEFRSYAPLATVGNLDVYVRGGPWWLSGL